MKRFSLTIERLRVSYLLYLDGIYQHEINPWVVFYDDTKEDGRRFDVNLFSGSQTAGDDGYKSVHIDVFSNKDLKEFKIHRKFKPYHEPFFMPIRGDKDTFMFHIPLSSIEFKYNGETRELTNDGDYIRIFDQIFIGGYVGCDKQKWMGFNVLKTLEMSAACAARQKLLKEMRENGAYSMTDWDLKRILEHYKITKKRKV